MSARQQHLNWTLICLLLSGGLAGCSMTTTTASKPMQPVVRHSQISVVQVTDLDVVDDVTPSKLSKADVENTDVATPPATDQVDDQQTIAPDSKNPLNHDSRRIIFSWAAQSLLRAQTMMHGSDDVALIVEASMDKSDAYRNQLQEQLTRQGVADPQSRKAVLTRIENHIRDTTRDFVLQARTMLKRQDKTMPQNHDKQDVLI
jgi:hypothetical protein